MARAPKASAPYDPKSHLSRERVDAGVDRVMAPEIAKTGDRKGVRKRWGEDDAYAKQITARFHADVLLSSACQAATIQTHTAETAKCDVDLEWQVQALERSAAQLKSGDMSGAEEMLLHQATALGSMFTFLTLRAMGNVGQSMDAVEMYMKIALRCQSQARATLETIAAIKNPPIVYARQANFANGPQQVNNGASPCAHAAKTKDQPNELSKVTHEEGQRLDIGTLQGPGDTCERVEAVGAVDRTSDGRRESAVRP